MNAMWPFNRPHRVRLRKIGYVFIIVSCLVLLASWNTGTNLYYVIFSGVFSLVFVAFVLCGRGTRNIDMRRDAPGAVHRNAAFDTTVHLRNQGRRFAARAFRVDSLDAGHTSHAFVPVLAPGASTFIVIKDRFTKRGVHRLPSLALASTYPFALTEFRKVMDDRKEIVVYPRVWSVRTSFLEQLHGGGRIIRRNRGQGDEYYGLRDYEPGDPLRRVSWKASARRGHLMVKELEQETSHQIRIVFDNRYLPDIEDFSQAFEDTIELVASLAMTFLNRQYLVGLAVSDSSVPLGEGKSHGLKILDLLARVNPASQTENDPFARVALAEELGRETILCVSTDPAAWGRRTALHGVRVLDPREVVLA